MPLKLHITKDWQLKHKSDCKEIRQLRESIAKENGAEIGTSDQVVQQVAPRAESQIIRGNMWKHRKIRVLDDGEIVLLGSFSDMGDIGERHNQAVTLYWWRIQIPDLLIANASSQKILGVGVLSTPAAKLVAVTLGAWGNKDTWDLISYTDSKFCPMQSPLDTGTQKNP